MIDSADSYFAEDPRKWISDLPSYQKDSIDELLKQGRTFEEIAGTWISTTTDNTYPFGATATKVDKGKFLNNLVLEIEEFICGSKKYSTERKKLFGEQGMARTYIVSTIAVAIAPSLGMSATVLAPVVALSLASFGKITINAWCAARKEARSSSATLQTP